MIPADYHTSCFQENNCEDFTEQFPVKGYIEFDEALEIYLDVCQYDINDEKRSDQLRTAFKDALMDEESELRCFIFTAINRKQYIVHDSDEIYLKSYFLELTEQDDEFLHENKFRKLSVDNHNQFHRYIREITKRERKQDEDANDTINQYSENETKIWRRNILNQFNSVSSSCLHSHFVISLLCHWTQNMIKM